MDLRGNSTQVSIGLHSPLLKDLLDSEDLTRHRVAKRPVGFIERKSLDLQELSHLLQVSADTNQWANFGPATVLLEIALTRHLRLAPSRAVVMCSSGTVALFGLIGLKNSRAGKRLRWALSAYSFRCMRVGPLAGAMVLDCDSCGFLSLDALNRLDSASYDGVILTNIFGLARGADDYIQFCRRMGKELIIDNAGLLEGFQRQEPPFTDEFLSFHQTKPWGMGEGGCVIVDREDAQLFRGLINCGAGLPDAAFPDACNGKISDFASALILQRLLHAPEWKSAYQEQAKRVLKVAKETGLSPLGPMDTDNCTVPHLPMLASRPFPASALANPAFVMHKYYKPLSSSVREAWAIYDRIVNIPCHPGMALLTDEEIRQPLESLTTTD